jgi:hypothetical protein
VPLVGGGIAYLLLRRSMAQLQRGEVEGSLYA